MGSGKSDLSRRVRLRKLLAVQVRLEFVHRLRRVGCFGPLALGLGLLLAGCTACAGRRQSAGWTRFEFSEPQMGMEFRVVLYAPDAGTARHAVNAMYRRVTELNLILSDYEEDSELTQLNRTAGSGRAVRVSPDLWRVLEEGQEWAQRTHGAFDMTVGPVVQLWRRARRQHELPSRDRLERARAAVGYAYLELDPPRRAVRLTRPGMRLDLGGIAKGYVLDEAVRVLERHGLRRVLLQAGGDLVVGDPPPGRPAWRVETSSASGPGAPPAQSLLLRRCALATSGDLFQYVEIDGVRYSHIVDPRTGLGLTDHSQVSVIARRGMTADALATALSVLGPSDGIALVEDTSGAAARVVRKVSGRWEIWESRRWARYPVPAGPPPSSAEAALGRLSPASQGSCCRPACSCLRWAGEAKDGRRHAGLRRPTGRGSARSGSRLALRLLCSDPWRPWAG